MVKIFKQSRKGITVYILVGPKKQNIKNYIISKLSHGPNIQTIKERYHNLYSCRPLKAKYVNLV